MSTVPSFDDFSNRLIADAKNGVLIWKSTRFRAWDALHSGKEALCSPHLGYKRGTLFGRQWKAHRIIWLLCTGEWPTIIDHINGDRSDNRIANLRDVSWKENARNSSSGRRNTSGVVGVTWNRECGKWQSFITADRKQIHLGLYPQLEDAVNARMLAQHQLGFGPNHGRNK